MQLYYIRHAQSENNALWDRTGSSLGRSDDPELTEIGKEQARLVAEFLSLPGENIEGVSHDSQNQNGFHLTHLYSSLMLRSVETGTAISKATGVPLVGWEELHETGGIYLKDPETGERKGLPGKTRAYFKSTYPDFVLPETVGEEGWWNRAYEQEEEILLRARSVVEKLMQRHGNTDDRVALVSHGGFFNLVLAVLLDLDVDRRVWFSLNNAAITRIDFREDETFLVYMNRADFLPRSLIT